MKKTIFFLTAICLFGALFLTGCEPEAKPKVDEWKSYRYETPKDYELDGVINAIEFGYKYMYYPANGADQVAVQINKILNADGSTLYGLEFQYDCEAVSSFEEQYFDSVYFVGSDYDQDHNGGGLVCTNCSGGKPVTMMYPYNTSDPKPEILYPDTNPNLSERRVAFSGIFPYNLKTHEEEWVIKFVSDAHSDRNVEHIIPAQYVKEMEAWLNDSQNFTFPE